MPAPSTPKRPRPFRQPESFAEELQTRDAIAPFLASRGFTVLDELRKRTGTAIEQFLQVRDPAGAVLRMRVRLCWSRTKWLPSARKISAAQLRKELVNDCVDDTLDFLVARDREEGNSHHLIVQRDGGDVTYAALIPRDALPAIWRRQRDVSGELLAKRLLGRMRANHVLNGSSPSIWLQDDRHPASHAVPDVLWQWPEGCDLAKLPPVSAIPAPAVDDTLDDCPVPDAWLLGSDGGERRAVLRSEVRRDPQVRRAVIARATGCERDGCAEVSRYPGFLDVHHILGAEKGDRVWNCVALCPNCHRDAHYSPEATALNRQLLAYAEQFQPARPAANGQPAGVLGDG